MKKLIYIIALAWVSSVLVSFAGTLLLKAVGLYGLGPWLLFTQAMIWGSVTTLVLAPLLYFKPSINPWVAVSCLMVLSGSFVAVAIVKMVQFAARDLPPSYFTPGRPPGLIQLFRDYPYLGSGVQLGTIFLLPIPIVFVALYLRDSWFEQQHGEVKP